MGLEDALRESRAYLTSKIERFGAVPQGVDFNGPEAQSVRFDQLVKIIDSSRPCEVIDYGCGYGALVGYLREKEWALTYHGYDELEKMIEVARRQYGQHPNVDFTTNEGSLPVCDYLIAGSIFNLKFDATTDAWRDYTVQVLGKMNLLCRRGFSFDILTSYSDADKMATRPELYFADPLFYFDYCKRTFARDVALLHDYGLYDFTILVRKQI